MGTVLVVDDEPAILDIITKFLSKAGYRIIPALHAVEAIDLFDQAQGEIDLLISDYRLPDMRGDRLVEFLTQRQPSLRVIFVSGSYDALASLFATGAAYLEKPFLLPELLEAVERAMEKPVTQR